MRLTRRYRFSASHRLFTDTLSEAENRAIFGKCANPYGHGHDYALDVSVRGPLDASTGRIIDLDRLDRLVREAVVEPMEHANLNTDVAEFLSAGPDGCNLVPTTENLAVVVRNRLAAAWPKYFGSETGFVHAALDKIRIEETKRNIFEITEEA
jgi:6-pyruvoyltetrahydropterin/6-carboxytetrahydropterin synthase